MAPISTSLAEDLQILRISSPSAAWTSMLPQGTTPAATFYLFTASPSPSSSDGEEQAQAYDKSRIQPPSDNVFTAAYYMCRFLETVIQNGQFAVAGGFAMQIHGSTRQTFDVDICVKPQPGSPPPLRAMLQSSRIILPSSKYFGPVLRCYVKTGPSFGDHIQIDRAVQVDLLLNDFLPRRFTDHTMEATFNARKFRVLDCPCLLRCKLSSYSSRFSRNDYNDIKTLIFRYAEEIQGCKQELDREYVEIFINQGIVSRESQDTIQLFKRTLMLTEPSTSSAF